MSKELMGSISGALVVLSAVPYSVRVYQGKIKPHIISWGLWTLIGFSLLLTYKSSGAGANVWPAVFGFTNPLLVMILVIWRKGTGGKLSRLDALCLFLGLVALVMWWFMRADQSLAQYALYVSIIADACAAIPTFAAYYADPTQDRPFAWLIFAVGYGLAVFAVPEPTLANYILPIYMFLGASLIAVPLVLYRARNRVSLGEWI